MYCSLPLNTIITTQRSGDIFTAKLVRQYTHCYPQSGTLETKRFEKEFSHKVEGEAHKAALEYYDSVFQEWFWEEDKNLTRLYGSLD